MKQERPSNLNLRRNRGGTAFKKAMLLIHACKYGMGIDCPFPHLQGSSNLSLNLIFSFPILPYAFPPVILPRDTSLCRLYPGALSSEL